MEGKSYRKKDLDDEISDVKKAYTKKLIKEAETHGSIDPHLGVVSQIKTYLVRLLWLKNKPK